MSLAWGGVGPVLPRNMSLRLPGLCGEDSLVLIKQVGWSSPMLSCARRSTKCGLRIERSSNPRPRPL
ncbi:hypothetical protein HaLaN_27506 [Haematococcus lacustris]|uniref:Uncharacterized protein n=1 Tax=Haematococcus lacustris TaxID=44745 RepID=A0A6A0A8L1_HAELA|nr:hypothetical protein HaLaN_27506 [Haematococcus lacustris]